MKIIKQKTNDAGNEIVYEIEIKRVENKVYEYSLVEIEKKLVSIENKLSSIAEEEIVIKENKEALLLEQGELSEILGLIKK